MSSRVPVCGYDAGGRLRVRGDIVALKGMIVGGGYRLPDFVSPRAARDRPRGEWARCVRAFYETRCYCKFNDDGE